MISGWVLIGICMTLDQNVLHLHRHNLKMEYLQHYFMISGKWQSLPLLHCCHTNDHGGFILVWLWLCWNPLQFMYRHFSVRWCGLDCIVARDEFVPGALVSLWHCAILPNSIFIALIHFPCVNESMTSF